MIRSLSYPSSLREHEFVDVSNFSEVKEWDEAVKSISRSGTFAEDTNDPVKIAGFLELLAESVHRALC